MKQQPKYKRITPLRAMELLAECNESAWTEGHRLKMVKRALEDHVKAALVKGKR